MNKILKRTFCFLILISHGNNTARGDILGADIALLSQILAESISQLAQLKQILGTGEDTLGLLREINRGINDSLKMAETLGIPIDERTYKNVRSVHQADVMVERQFGKTVDSPLANVQISTDEKVAEAISFNSELQDYTKKLDLIGEQIKAYSHATSPGGASKLTAQALGVMIHVMNEEIRATGAGLKLQAQALAIQNKKDKDATAGYLKEAQVLKTHMQKARLQFQVPRF